MQAVTSNMQRFSTLFEFLQYFRDGAFHIGSRVFMVWEMAQPFHESTIYARLGLELCAPAFCLNKFNYEVIVRAGVISDDTCLSCSLTCKIHVIEGRLCLHTGDTKL